MLYLAKTKKGELERIQVIRDPKQLGIWGALNHDGTKVLVPFSKSNVNYECVLNTLIEKYETLTLSKRKVDTSYLHIICFNNQYYLYDDNGFCVKKFGKTRITFSNPGCGEITEHHTEEVNFPDYYEDINIIHNDLLWVAKDIDINQWVCLQKDGTVISQDAIKKTCIDQAIQKLS